MELRRSLILVWMVLVFSLSAAFADNSSILEKKGTPVISKALGVETIAASVLFHAAKNPGLYINSSPDSGALAKRMGLKEGNVLLTLDGFSAYSAEAVDRWIKSRPAKPLHFTYAVFQHGQPKLYEKRIHSPQNSADAPSEVTGSASSGSQAAAVPSANATVAPGTTATSTNSNFEFATADLEAYILTLINESRRAEGSPPLQADPALSRLARDYADYMLQHPEHYVRPVMSPHLDLQGRIPQMRAFDAGIHREVHENLSAKPRGRQRNDKELALYMHQEMMAEPAGQHNHRSILLDPNAKAVGIGIGRQGSSMYLVEEFGH